MRRKNFPTLTADNFRALWEKGRWDVELWAGVFLGIRLHKGQVRMAQAYLKRTDSRWRAFYLWLMIAAGNRAGKTLGLSIIILHSCVYRMGLKPPEDPEDPDQVTHWARMPYHWWHFAVEQGPAEQVFNEQSWLLGGVHPAQEHGCPWSMFMGQGDSNLGAKRIAVMTDNGQNSEWASGAKERGEYAWIKFTREWGGAEIHFRSTKAKAIGSIGQNMHGWSFDEAGLQETPSLDWLLREVLHARRLSTGGQGILIGTASVATTVEFQDLWATGDPDDPFREPYRFSMRMSTRENIGYGIEKVTFDRMIEGQDENWIAQNIDGKFIQSILAWFNKNSIDAIFWPGLPVEQDPVIGNVYLQSLDPGLRDLCWSLVFKVTKDGKAIGVSIQKQVGKQTTRGIVALGARQHQRYGMWVKEGANWQKDPETRTFASRATILTGVDSTALGGHMFKELLEEEVGSVISVEFGGVTQIKRRMLSDLRTAIDEGIIIMPTEGDWKEVSKQLTNYKLLDRKVEQDLVMGLAIIVKILRMAPRPGEVIDATFVWGTTEEEPKVPRPNPEKEKEQRAARRQAARDAETEQEYIERLRRGGNHSESDIAVLLPRWRAKHLAENPDGL